MKIKKSESRIIIFLKNTDKHLKYAQKISSILDIDYAYITKIINNMIIKGWITKHKYNHKNFLILTEKAPIKEASQNIINNQKWIKEIEQKEKN